MPESAPGDSSPKRALKLLRWRARRARSAWRWGSNNLAATPAVLGNAMPKSGSHLIFQVLQGLTRIGPFVNAGFPPVNRSEDNRKLPDRAILANLARLQPGDIAYGYIQARQPFLSALDRTGMATVFVYRDPRDMLVSHVFYATEMHPGHGLHRYYTQSLTTMEERLNAAIRGVQEPGAELSGVSEKYAAYLDWLTQPWAFCLRFEDLILERDRALTCLLDYLQSRGFTPQLDRAVAVEALKAAIQPRKSGTFRKGQPGNWREHFTPANKQLFKELAGDLLVRLGYEQDHNW
ncbi:MAG TPA: sulfotransferase domain-containing protein [Anaerolineales bacterium]|nr:sulfotransferase domain-containing protein [Anaerolineales bacterium]